ncbi:TIGR04423 family type III CRISPR-associated protein [Emticicia fluvialis]|uniref:TIGR04423 family type III CRISPR-associated protein n=1 Tax=Emticicia fluvialis TaxID=2974474 RepID=UPI0021652482|nr:TIGR04423 family type III CRISPR-associated protein [Emticicia fluvialis]
MKLNLLTDIPDYQYEGYVWMSDKQKPEVFMNKPFNANGHQQNPFIIEGLLWAKKEKVSIHIRHTGKYLIHKYEMNDQDLSEDINQYLAHKIEGIKKLKFKQVWEPEKDPFCEDMEVLKMKALVFIGFESENTK